MVGDLSGPHILRTSEITFFLTSGYFDKTYAVRVKKDDVVSRAAKRILSDSSLTLRLSGLYHNPITLVSITIGRLGRVVYMI
jgi:hypothetical protein